MAPPFCSSQHGGIEVAHCSFRYRVKVQKNHISPKRCFQKSHHSLVCFVCNSPSVAKSSSVKNGDALWAEKEEKKMLMFCSLASLVKIKLCGGNLCDFLGLFFLVVLHPSLQHCGHT